MVVSGRRKVLFVTGIRSEYDLLHSAIAAVHESPGMDVGLVVTGAHCSPMYGETAREVERDGFPIIARIENLLNSDSLAGRVKSAATQLAGLVDVLAFWRPDFVVAPMDREEAMTVALAGSYMRIPVVHIGGGDASGDGIDSNVRHAVTKLAHLHMVATATSAKRVTELGEESWRIHVVGALGLDRLLSTREMGDDELWQKIGRNPRGQPFALLIQHPIIGEANRAGELMRLTMESLLGLGLFTFVSYPNSDAGSQQVIEVIEQYSAEFPAQFHRYQNLGREEFVNLMRRAHVLVGNSSCGIIEAPLLRLPVVNIGPRQAGREHVDNIQFVEHDMDRIQTAVKRAVEDGDYRSQVARCVNPYGDGTAGRRIARILAEQAVDERLLKKIHTL